jgi:hypothetical protein
MDKVVCSLVFLVPADLDWVYLALGKIGRSKGYLNGYGGKQEEDETVAECASREIADPDESGGVTIEAGNLRKACVMVYYFDGEIDGLSRPNARTLELHVFVVHTWAGTPQETEGFKKAIRISTRCLPFERMLPDNKAWLERALSPDVPFTGEVWYATNKDGESVPAEIVIHEQPNQALLDIP